MHRRMRGLSLGELADHAGLSKSALSRIEASGGNPSVETLWRLARALGLPLGSLLYEPPQPKVRRIPKGEGKRIETEDGMAGWLLHTEGRAHRAELFDLELPAGLEHWSEPHLPHTEEIVVCTAGRIRVGPRGEEQDLSPGDAAIYEADCAHTYTALGDEVARALNWVLYP